ncbi:GNAT family N-acetyltransferase [Methylobacterium iners]|uniref:L-methionine sulfoximine/L-methionine sulfone acetyltransferase n=1 Tax=Methylobacterium iners TaxID=418707 RepID=A0ABQ4RXL6_9HYPH|nr:GNAT family N-acetyltransferase [Methylobacterium iners]GJD95585.1 L-methionine sulfoximine/L-methionine sulfone acetyltransferase [Methylobacterium iners]
MSLSIRDAGIDDLAAIAEIYRPHVLHGSATFETVPPSAAEMAARREAILAAGLPYLVAERDGRLLGYAYAGPYRARPAYRHTVENSVYVREGSGRQGAGGALLAALVARCEAGPWRQMVAVIGDSANAASIALHARHGFRVVGTLEAVGFKHGRWVDTVLMQRALGAGAGGDPPPPRS